MFRYKDSPRQPSCRLPGSLRLIVSLVLVAGIGMGCASGTQQSAGVPSMHSHVDTIVPTTATVASEVPPGEKAAAEEMIGEAMEDGVMTGQELELIVVEYIECIRRAGFEAALTNFNQRSGSFTSDFRDPQQDPNYDPREDPGYIPGSEPVVVAEAACDAVYVAPALDAFYGSNPRTEQEIRLEARQREQAVLDCLSEAGFEFETFDDYRAGLGDLPTDVALPCSQAYNE